MAIGFVWFNGNLVLSLCMWQLVSLKLGDNALGRGVGFMLHGVSG